MAVYIATAQPAPIVPWDETRPAFNAQRITDAEHAVLARFTHPNVAYLGAHTGCSCGFSYAREWAGSDEPDECLAAQESTRALREYLARVLKTEPEVELFACWEGDQDKPEIARRVVGPDHFGGDEFRFVERELLIVRPHA
jgi:hypothetical protein